jgi:hypothetical protein
MKRVFASPTGSIFTLLAAVSLGALAACGDAGSGNLSDTEVPGGASGGSGGSGSGTGSASGSGGGTASGGSGSAGSGSGSSGGGAGTSGDSDGGSAGTVTPAPIVTNVFATLKQGGDQMASFCSRGSTDKATTALCSASTKITGLADLQSALGLAFANPNGVNGAGGNPAFVLLGHSTSLSMNTISSANPRALLFSAPTAWVPADDPAMNGNGMGPPPGWEPPTGWTQPSNWTPPTFTGTMASWPPWDWGCVPTVAAAKVHSALLGSSPVHTMYGDDDDDDDDDGPVCFPSTISNPPTSSSVAMGFTRGTGIVEVAAAEPGTGALHFIAVHYTTADSAGGTASGSSDAGLVAPVITPPTAYGASSESNWTSWTAYDDSDLADTTLDCTHCHQPGGTGTTKQLRMNESGTPWTHTMSSWTAGGQALLGDFHTVHGTSEAYGGIPAGMIDKSEPMTLQLATGCDGCSAQPVNFDSTSIEHEVAASAPGQPANNATPGTSATWNKLYTTGLSNHTVVPYHDVKVTDPAKLATVAATYKATGSADMSHLMTADALTATLQTPPATMDANTLLQASCADCHNASVPTSLHRGLFDATNLAKMNRAMKDTAIARLQLTPADVKLMPPSNEHQLTAAQVQTLITLLQQ